MGRSSWQNASTSSSKRCRSAAVMRSSSQPVVVQELCKDWNPKRRGFFRQGFLFLELHSTMERKGTPRGDDMASTDPPSPAAAVKEPTVSTPATNDLATVKLGVVPETVSQPARRYFGA